MATNQIARDQWAEFLNKFSHSHTGRQATASLFGPGTGDHHEARALPFNGFEVEHGSPGSIVVMLGSEANDHLSHTISGPVQVWHKSGDGEPDEVIELRSDDGTALIVRFPPQG